MLSQSRVDSAGIIVVNIVETALFLSSSKADVTQMLNAHFQRKKGSFLCNHSADLHL